MPSPGEEDRQSQRAFDYSWNLFEACEGRQANYSKAKYAVSSLLLAAIGAILTFVVQDGKISGKDYLLTILITWAGALGVFAHCRYDAEISNWHKLGNKALERLDAISGQSFRKHCPAELDIKAELLESVGFWDFYLRNLKSKDIVFVAGFSLVIVVGLFIAVFSYFDFLGWFQITLGTAKPD